MPGLRRHGGRTTQIKVLCAGESRDKEEDCGKEPIKVRWVDTLKGNGIHRIRLVAKKFRRDSKYEGFANFSATPPLELVKLIISLVATAKRDPVSWFGWREHGANDQIAMMHTDISRAYFHAPSMGENTLSCHQKCGGRDTQNTED